MERLNVLDEPEESTAGQVTHGRKLTPKERSFAQYYVLLLNPRAAVIAAGLARSTDRALKVLDIGKYLLKDPDICLEIDALLDMQAAKLLITKDRVTAMLLNVYEAAFGQGDMSVAHRVAVDVAKLHGLMITQSKTEFSWRIEDMSEVQIKDFLGKRYNPDLIAQFTEDVKEVKLVEKQDANG